MGESSSNFGRCKREGGGGPHIRGNAGARGAKGGEVQVNRKAKTTKGRENSVFFRVGSSICTKERWSGERGKSDGE